MQQHMQSSIGGAACSGGRLAAASRPDAVCPEHPNGRRRPRTTTPAAIGLGVFIGCLPLYGFHLLICVAAGWLFKLNRLKIYLAANISNPFVAPWLLLAEFQVGSWLRRGTFHAITIDTIRNSSVASLGIDLIVGSVALGAVLAALAAWTLHVLMMRRDGRGR